MIQVAILGFGNIGSGIYEVLTRGFNKICREARSPVNIKYILDLRDFPDHPLGSRVVHDISVILNDPEVQIVCETMGGIKPAFEYSLACLNAGKNVITSNKEVVATFGNLLCDAARDNHVRYLYEASVGGGIPIIRSIQVAMAGERVTQIDGILNGTTNYVLTEMEKSYKTAQEAVREAQELGYAERDPSDDINGNDSTRKICILAALAFGTLVSPSLVNTEGIASIRPVDTATARKFGAAVKLIGSAKRYEDGVLDIRVTPCLVPADNPMANVDGVFNAISVKADFIGSVMFYGRGAGSLPTAGAIIADMIDVAKHLDKGQPIQDTWQVADPEMVCVEAETPACFYAAVLQSKQEVRTVFPDSEILYTDEEITAFLCDNITKVHFDRMLRDNRFEVISNFRAVR